LIGDSICNAYYQGVADSLRGKAIVAKMATSYSLADPMFLNQLKVLLTSYKFSVIHVNNGLHGFDYTESEYQKQYAKALKLIKECAPNAKLIVATSTPMRKGENLKEFSPQNERVKARNKIVADFAAKQNIPIDDLYILVDSHPEYWSNDGVHFNGNGIDVEAKQVSHVVSKLL
jgi:lysophospholipase L1-like esterase